MHIHLYPSTLCSSSNLCHYSCRFSFSFFTFSRVLAQLWFSFILSYWRAFCTPFWPLLPYTNLSSLPSLFLWLKWRVIWVLKFPLTSHTFNTRKIEKFLLGIFSPSCYFQHNQRLLPSRWRDLSLLPAWYGWSRLNSIHQDDTVW